MKSSYTVPLSIIFGGIIVAIAVYVSMPKSATRDANNLSLVRPVGMNDHILGNPAARVMVVEYSDFDCEFCKNFNETLHHIIANEGATGDVAWVFRQFPLIEKHPHALSHARAAECAAAVAGNDTFWRFKSVLFANQPVNPASYGTLAKAAGISDNAFATCFASASTTIEARIMADRRNALDMGAKGAPFSLILVEGKPPVVMEGAYPYGAVKQLVEQMLAK